MMQRGGMGGSPLASRSLSVSSDSDAVDEPAVLEEARKGSSAAAASRSSRGRSRISWGISRSSQSSSSADSDDDSPRPRRALLSSTSRGIRSRDRANGSRHTFSSRRQVRVSFMDEPASSSSTGDIQSHGTAEGALGEQFKEAAKRSRTAQFDMKASTACRAQAFAYANRNVAAISSEKQAIDETQNSAFDAMEHEVDGLHRQLHEVKESLRKRCLNIFNSLVGRKWTIDTSDTLVKRMLRPSKWTGKSQVQLEAQEGQGPKDWFGPSANDVFGDCLVIADRNPYRIVGVFARRYRDTRQRLPYLNDIVCPMIFPCIQNLEPQTGRPVALKVPFEPPKPIKAFPDDDVTLPANETSAAGSKRGSSLEDTTDSAVSTRRDRPSYRRESNLRISSVPAPSRASWSIGQDSARDRTDACCTARCLRPCSRYTCVIPPGNYVQSSALESYPKAAVEYNNMRIPTRLADYLERNCVTIERPSWDRRRKKNELHHADSRRSRSSAQSDDTESTWEEDEDYEQKSFGFNSCEISSMLPDSISSGLPQFLRREIGNRWLPTLFAEADVRISEYWKLENMRSKEKAAWVYQGIQAEPTPYPWEEVPLEGKPLSPQEIAQQRKDARSRRHLSIEAERLLRGIGHGSGCDGEANALQRRTDDCSTMNSKNSQMRGRSPVGDQTPAQTTTSRCTVNPPGTRAIRRVR
ncbi:hypothetical protein, conserved [Eimeria brunetti]|uniref:Uncharacterized protein n=1 Tax=Eimeria brunetti TaxID=51314 RepID=U6LU80_9EIME|nr:hypothetical protein, conserved [Eimeria brunetti]